MKSLAALFVCCLVLLLPACTSTTKGSSSAAATTPYPSATVAGASGPALRPILVPLPTPSPPARIVSSGGSGSSAWQLVYIPNPDGTVTLSVDRTGGAQGVSGHLSVSDTTPIQSGTERIAQTVTLVYGVAQAGFVKVSFVSDAGVTTSGNIEAEPATGSTVTVFWVQVPNTTPSPPAGHLQLTDSSGNVVNG